MSTVGSVDHGQAQSGDELAMARPAPAGRSVVKVARLGQAARGLARLCPLVAGLLLLYTGIVKWGDVPAFSRTMGTHGLLPEWSLGLVAYSLPIAEVILGVGALTALALARAETGACMALAVLFLAFMGYSGMMHASPPPEPTGCGCGLRAGPIRDWTPLVVQNGACAVLLGIAGFIIHGSRGPMSMPRSGSPS